MSKNLSLIDGVKRHEKHPATFDVPSDEDKAKVRAGDFVKVGFERVEGGQGERMWLIVTEPGKGTLDNDPVLFAGTLKLGDVIEFKPENILDILTPEDFK